MCQLYRLQNGVRACKGMQGHVRACKGMWGHEGHVSDWGGLSFLCAAIFRLNILAVKDYEASPKILGEDKKK